MSADDPRSFGLRLRRPPSKLAERLELEEAHDPLAELNVNVSRLTEIVANLGGNQVNHVLFSGTGQIPAAGDNYWSTNTRVPYARVFIQPITNDVRVENMSPRNAPATALVGRGMLWCPAAAGKLDFPLAGDVITVYGAAGTLFNLALISKEL